MAHAETGARRRSAPANIDEAVHLAPASLRRPPAVTINETNGSRSQCRSGSNRHPGGRGGKQKERA